MPWTRATGEPKAELYLSYPFQTCNRNINMEYYVPEEDVKSVQASDQLMVG
jgi:hypothetical protein